MRSTETLHWNADLAGRTMQLFGANLELRLRDVFVSKFKSDWNRMQDAEYGITKFCRRIPSMVILPLNTSVGFLCRVCSWMHLCVLLSRDCLCSNRYSGSGPIMVSPSSVYGNVLP